MVLSIVDEVADVMQDRGIFKPGALGGSQTMEAGRLVEEAQRQAGDMEAMDFRRMTATGQRHDIAPSQIGNLPFRFESFTVAVNKVVDDTFANGLVTEDEFVSF